MKLGSYNHGAYRKKSTDFLMHDLAIGCDEIIHLKEYVGRMKFLFFK